MRVAVVGPTHPYKGGVAAHTTELAAHLAAAGHESDLISWSHLYPSKLYPGEQVVPDGVPDLPPYPRTTRPLSWARPDSWVRVGRQLREYDLVILVHVVPAVVPAHLALVRALGADDRPRVVLLMHNVLPHETHPGAEGLVRTMLANVDGALVHSAEQAAIARQLGARVAQVAPLPPHLPGGAPMPRIDHDGPPRVLTLGMVRDYKGVDLLLEALGQVPGPTLTIAGELWGEAGRRVCEMATDPAVRDRVTVRGGYVPATAIAGLLASHDVLALPYRTATASQNALLGFAHGLPVLATAVGTFATEVSDGVDGLVVAPGDVSALAGALRRLMEPGQLPKLRDGVREPDLTSTWRTYVAALEALASPPGDGAPQTAAPPGGRVLAVAKRGAEHALWARVAVQRRAELQLPQFVRDVPRGVSPTDVLRTREAWEQAVLEARRLRLPPHHDRPKNWDALGAVAAVLQLADGGSRTARVMDAGSARYSPVLPWLRLYGLGNEPESLLGINLEFGARVVRDGVTFRYGDVTNTGLVDGALDAITCMSVIEHGVPLREFITESARVLRPGGVLTLSTDYDSQPPDTEGMSAYGGPVRIFGPADLRKMVAMADDVGLDLVGDLETPGFFEHAQRPVHWERLGLDYTFVLLTFRRR